MVASEHGVGALSAAQILLSWTHAGRIRSEAAFAMLSGTARAALTYVQRRRAEGKIDKEIHRCVKRYLARHLYRVLNQA